MLSSTYIRITVIGFALCFATTASARYIESDPVGLTADNQNGTANHLYVYANNNPIAYIDPKGLFHYKDGVPAAGAEVEAGLRCMDKELGTDLGISGGGECVEPHNTADATRGHCAGKAADISDRMNSGLIVNKVICAAKKCGFKYAKKEKDHADVKTHTDLANRSGDISQYNCDCSK